MIYHLVYEVPRAAGLCCSRYSLRGELLKVFTPPGAGRILSLRCFVCVPSSASSRGCSHPQNLLPWAAWLFGRERSWPADSLSPQPQGSQRMALQWIPSQAHQGDSERTELKAKIELAFCFFGEQGRMSSPHFEFRYYSECIFNLIQFKLCLESEVPKFPK